MYNQYAIYNATGKIAINFRPPYGDIDDRVRAIAHALGLRTVLWNYVSDDTSASSPAGAEKVLNTIKSWFTITSGFISLQHDINPTTTQIAISALSAIKTLAAGFTLKPQPVGQCIGLSPSQWYQYVAPGSPIVSPVNNSTAGQPVTGQNGTGNGQNGVSTGKKGIVEPISGGEKIVAGIAFFVGAALLL